MGVLLNERIIYIGLLGEGHMNLEIVGFYANFQ